MLTETWALDYSPVLPPRWDPRMSPPPVTVYLDQWCYDHLARDRAGKPQDPGEAGCFEYFRRLALDGRVVFVLSHAHYWENWRRDNEDARWDTAVAMAELTGFNTITPAGLAYWEALEAVAAHTGTDANIEPPQVLGWGIAHCLRGGEGSAMIIDTRSGRPASWEDLPEQTRARLDELDRSSAERFELAVLAGRDPRLEPGVMLPFAAVPDDGRGDLLVQEERGIRIAIDQVGESESNIRVIVEGRSVSPFVDYLVTDKSMCLLAEAAGLQRRGGATIMRRLADLRERLELALGH